MVQDHPAHLQRLISGFVLREGKGPGETADVQDHLNLHILNNIREDVSLNTVLFLNNFQALILYQDVTFLIGHYSLNTLFYRGHLEKNGFRCICRSPLDFSNSAECAKFTRKIQASLVIGIHVFKTGRLLIGS